MLPRREHLAESCSRSYTLAMGEGAAHRLELLHRVYGPATLRLLEGVGVKGGVSVADLGCGVGIVTEVLSQLVGAEGTVVGVDFSAAQLAQARQRLSGGHRNVTLVEASATETPLPAGSFDFVYCRFLLMHLAQPELALREMRRLLRPGGVLICEDGDLTSAQSDPPSALDAFSHWFGILGPARGVDYTFGRRLFQLVQAAGFAAPEVSLSQSAYSRGDEKRLLDLSIAEAGAALVETGLIGADELEQTLAQMRQAAADERVLAVMPRMTQVWARK